MMLCTSMYLRASDSSPSPESGGAPAFTYSAAPSSAAPSSNALSSSIVLDVLLLFAALHLVERRLGDVDVAVLDELGHLTVEERQQQRADMASVDVRIGVVAAMPPMPAMKFSSPSTEKS